MVDEYSSLSLGGDVWGREGVGVRVLELLGRQAQGWGRGRGAEGGVLGTPGVRVTPHPKIWQTLTTHTMLHLDLPLGIVIGTHTHPPCNPSVGTAPHHMYDVPLASHTLALISSASRTPHAPSRTPQDTELSELSSPRGFGPCGHSCTLLPLALAWIERCSPLQSPFCPLTHTSHHTPHTTLLCTPPPHLPGNRAHPAALVPVASAALRGP